MNEALCDAERRRLMEHHPVRTKFFRIPTPPLKRAFEVIVHLIASGAPGAAFVAYPRFGKTYGATYCVRKLPDVFPKIPVVFFNAHDDKRPTDARLFRDLLEQSGYSPGGSRTAPDELRARVVRAWFSMAADSESHTVVLIVDEAQKLSADGYSWLIDVTNDLHKLDVRVITLLFGQPELELLRQTFLTMRRGDILGRFMTRVLAFEGIRSAVELREVMECYDDPEKIVYPVQSDWCFTRFFLPEAYAHGWRLAAHAVDLWSQFERRARPGLSSSTRVAPISVGMEWIAGALQYVLVNNWDNDRPRLKLDADAWSAAVDSTGFESSLELSYAP